MAFATLAVALLAGRGVAPDVVVPFDVRYADGKDLQLEKAIEILSASEPSMQ
jgi:carboxyl-terminal processing protease